MKGKWIYILIKYIKPKCEDQQQKGFLSGLLGY